MKKQILFVHGYGHTECWINFKKEFYKKDSFELFFFNYRNHGKNMKKIMKFLQIIITLKI